MRRKWFVHLLMLLAVTVMAAPAAPPPDGVEFDAGKTPQTPPQLLAERQKIQDPQKGNLAE